MRQGSSFSFRRCGHFTSCRCRNPASRVIVLSKTQMRISQCSVPLQGISTKICSVKWPELMPVKETDLTICRNVAGAFRQTGTIVRHLRSHVAFSTPLTAHARTQHSNRRRSAVKKRIVVLLLCILFLAGNTFALVPHSKWSEDPIITVIWKKICMSSTAQPHMTRVRIFTIRIIPILVASTMRKIMTSLIRIIMKIPSVKVSTRKRLPMSRMTQKARPAAISP